ncbi:glycerol-3-phosphate acyltransferase 3 isoform X3 [Betta splendens]|uniref:Glycerol-3-phosphate acyltransferase 3 isoform X3 n=2 Tax=Betta splendens TaxID=158456 RepID=A0A9W2Y6U8_BETSP|nr:glycerol-3-phosphate acyltransferase 3 isoform X3 [Betta splendens]
MVPDGPCRFLSDPDGPCRILMDYSGRDGPLVARDRNHPGRVPVGEQVWEPFTHRPLHVKSPRSNCLWVSLKSWLSELVHLTCYRICARGLSATIRYHNRENRPRTGGICVANHTTPIDVVILANDRCYAMVGQIHGGLMGIMQRSMLRSCPHVWFERSEMKDRHAVTRRLRAHVAAQTKLPILIFPEGTCVNNTSVMMFKKGSFEIGGTIYPVAIKYDPRFGDAFWNSSKYTMVSYLLRTMTSWAVVVDVWYLPPMSIRVEEDAAHFASRVKSAIARRGGLLDLSWDGALKRGKVKDSLKEEQQRMYSSIISMGTGWNGSILV